MSRTRQRARSPGPSCNARNNDEMIYNTQPDHITCSLQYFILLLAVILVAGCALVWNTTDLEPLQSAIEVIALNSIVTPLQPPPHVHTCAQDSAQSQCFEKHFNHTENMLQLEDCIRSDIKKAYQSAWNTKQQELRVHTESIIEDKNTRFSKAKRDLMEVLFATAICATLVLVLQIVVLALQCCL